VRDIAGHGLAAILDIEANIAPRLIYQKCNWLCLAWHWRVMHVCQGIVRFM